MSKIDEIKAVIESLTRDEFDEIVRWLSEKNWENWDKEIETDSHAGTLNFLLFDAQNEKAKNRQK